MEEMQAIRYLESLIGQTLRVHTTDTRMFVGTFKCTDAVSAPWPCHDPVSRS
jgi:small nuclear ribonucleoprotein (snRNP)-like protein